MIAVIQRVSYAKLLVDDKPFSQIDGGILALIGIEKADVKSDSEKLLSKILDYRIFNDEDGKMNLSVRDIGGCLMLVSQFTLAAQTTNGLRPSFSPAKRPKEAEEIYNYLVEITKKTYEKTAFGKFGANMRITLENDGPVTFCLRI